MLPGAENTVWRGSGKHCRVHAVGKCIKAWPFIRACYLGLLPSQQDCTASAPEGALAVGSTGADCRESLMLIAVSSGPPSEEFKCGQDWETEHFTWNSNLGEILAWEGKWPCLFVCLLCSLCWKSMQFMRHGEERNVSRGYHSPQRAIQGKVKQLWIIVHLRLFEDLS